MTAKYLMLYKKLQFFNTYVSVSCSYVYISDKSELFLWHFPDLMILIFYINNKSKHAVEDPTVTVKWSVMLDSLSCSFTSISFLTIHTNKSYSKQDQTVNTWTYLLLSFKCFHSINWSIPRFFVDFLKKDINISEWVIVSENKLHFDEMMKIVIMSALYWTNITLLDFHSAISLKQLSACWHVALLAHIIMILRQHIFALAS